MRNGRLGLRSRPAAPARIPAPDGEAIDIDESGGAPRHAFSVRELDRVPCRGVSSRRRLVAARAGGPGLRASAVTTLAPRANERLGRRWIEMVARELGAEQQRGIAGRGQRLRARDGEPGGAGGEQGPESFHGSRRAHAVPSSALLPDLTASSGSRGAEAGRPSC